jgi:ribosomal protein S1
MDEYAWPTGPEVPAAEDRQRSWEATVAALPVGHRMTGKVVGRQRFGVFLLMEDAPDAMALAEITAMPLGMDLPAIGALVRGQVLWHAEHNHQVKVRLDEWRATGE